MYEKILDYLTYPKTFENYKWYKPILVFIVAFVVIMILDGLILLIFNYIMGFEFVKNVFSGGYELFNSAIGLLFVDSFIITIIPSLYIASKIVKDRPFSSYSSSRGGWNFRLYLKALIIPLILYVSYAFIESVITGSKGTYQLSIPFLIVLFICFPLQSIAEEYAFRGLIMQTLGSWFNIPVLALILQAVIFALGHDYNSIGLVEMVVAGIILGFFAWKTNGIEVSSAMHTASNFSVGLSVMLGLRTSTSTPQLYSVLATIVLEIVLLIIMYYVGKKTNWFGEIPENY